ncbi:hypothetical protein DID88_007402 [Monilinia fructigena]|nr:hypothetical protein DID88_007402 [Monilinia fructigena]
MLLPAIIFSHDISFKTDLKQRDARDWLRRLEHAVSMRSEIEEKEGYVREGVIDLDAINRDLVECHSQVLWKRPKAYLQILQQLEKAMMMFDERLPEERKDETMRALQAITHIQRYSDWISREAHSTTLSRKKNLNSISKWPKKQRQLGHAAKRDSSTMKTISLLSAIFFPGVYLASVFSMTFFNFQDDGTPAGGGTCGEKKRERRYNLEDIDLEKGSDDMEKEIMATMRKRTMSKASTWDRKNLP